MAKVTPPRKRRREQGSVNWLLIGGVIAVGAVGLFALLFVTLQSQGLPTPTPNAQADAALEDFCAANDPNCIAKGEADAPVTVIEVSDYGCPHCRNFNLDSAPSIDETYVDTGQVRWVVMPYALRQETLPASVAAMCAADQDMFFPYHFALFGLQATDQAFTQSGFVQTAESLDMDVEAFESCLQEGTYASLVQRNMQAAASAGVNATPTFFVNGLKVEGNNPDGLRQAIENELGS